LATRIPHAERLIFFVVVREKRVLRLAEAQAGVRVRGERGFIEPSQNQAQKKLEPSEQQTDVLADAGEDGVEAVAVPVLEEVAPERPSSFMWPITGSMAARRLSWRLMRGVSPRF
jgi:hypothetical protein